MAASGGTALLLAAALGPLAASVFSSSSAGSPGEPRSRMRVLSGSNWSLVLQGQWMVELWVTATRPPGVGVVWHRGAQPFGAAAGSGLVSALWGPARRGAGDASDRLRAAAAWGWAWGLLLPRRASRARCEVPLVASSWRARCAPGSGGCWRGLSSESGPARVRR